MTRWFRQVTSFTAAVGLAALALSAGGVAAAASGSHAPGNHKALGKPYNLPASKHHGSLGSFASNSQTRLQREEAAATKQAARTGRAVAVASLTTATEMVVAGPDGMLTMTSSALPVRVHRGHRWVPVQTNLRRSDGMLTAPALPADTVRFSPGGSGPMAEIQTGKSRLELWWPRPLPAPVVSSSSATYRNVLPGVNLVLTAEDGTTGSFSEALVVSSRRAAAEVRSIDLRVTSRGAKLQDAKGGGLVAPLTGGRGAFVAPPAVMWDSGTSAQNLKSRAAAMGGKAAGVAPAGGVPDVSTFQGPGRYALAAPVAARVGDGGRQLRLVPDSKLLDSAQTRYPVVIDPTLYLETNGGGTLQAYDPVQSGSDCTGAHYNSSSYYDSPVGYDDFSAGNCQYNDTDYALYRVGVSTALGASGVTIATAAVKANVAYSSDCGVSATVTLSWIGGMSSSTGWPGPGKTSDDTDERATFAADSPSCNTEDVTDDGALKSASFNVKPDINDMKGSSNFTFRLWEPAGTGDGSPTNEDYHVQIANGKHDSDGPYLQVQFFDKPATVSTSSMEESTSSNDSNPYACATTTAAAPAVVPTQAGGGIYTGAVYSDPDGHSQLGGTVHYFLASDSGSYDTTASPASAVPSSSGSYSRAWDTAPVPWSWLSAQTNGAIVGWDTEAYTGTDTVSGTTYGPFDSAAFSGVCYFADYWNKPEAPTVSAGFTQGDAQDVGTTISFSIAKSANDANAPSEYVFGIDKEPPTTGTIPDSQLCTTSSTTTPDCVINSSSGAATLTVVVPSPGPHMLWVYEVDSKSVASGETDGALADSSSDCQNDDVAGCAWAGYTFTGAGDPSCSTSDTTPCFTSGASLQANFDDALSSGYADNTLISNSSGTQCSTTSGDGGGSQFYAPQLSAAGWGAGDQVTVDGASFLVPSYGGCGEDNVLAANQTIGTGSSGATGSALVVLATSTVASVALPGVVSGDPNAEVLQSDTTAPAVAGGAPVTGTGCLVEPDFADSGCVPATGTVNYASGCAEYGDQTSVPYDLTVPDWVGGPADIQAVSTADRVNSAEQADSPKIYAFAIPIAPGCSVASVTLPDVGASVRVTSPSGDAVGLPALHIFGLAIRNTSTTTPEASPAAGTSGTMLAAPSGQAWTAAAESPVEDALGPPSGDTWGNQTFREQLTPTVTAAAGSQVRIQLSDPGFLSADGVGPLQIGAASITAGADATPDEPMTALTFGGSASVTIPEGGMVYSDPVTLPFTVTAGQPVLVSLWIKNASLPVLPVNAWSSAGVMWWASSAVPNETGDTTGTPFTGSTGAWSGVTAVLTGLDVTTAAETVGGEASPGDPTIVVAGDNVVDGFSSDALGDSLDVPSNRLAGQLYRQGLTAGYGVVDAGVEANQLLADGSGVGGVSLMARLDRDVLTEPDVGTVVVDEGLEDVLGSSASEVNVDTAYSVLIDQLNAFGINVIVTTMTPCEGYVDDGHTCADPGNDLTRMDVNTDVTTSQLYTPQPYCDADVDSIVSNGGTPTEALSTSPTDYDAGDHANLSVAGYAAMADAFNPADTQDSPCTFAPNVYPPS